jgi:Ca-activated chloride channel homolog
MERQPTPKNATMNDPRITAYALGDLDDPAREEFEQELAASDALQYELAEVGKMVHSLRALPAPADGFDLGQRADLLAQCAHNLGAVSRRRKIIRLAVPLAIAALVSVLAIPVLTPHRSDSLVVAETARRELSTPRSLVKGPPPRDQAADEKLKQEIQTSLGRESLVSSQVTTLVAPSGATVAQSVVTPAGMAMATASVGVPVQQFTSGWGRGVASGTGVRSRDFHGAEGGFKPTAPAESNTEGYNAIQENSFLSSADHPLSTFSIDVDTASYANVRRFLLDDQLPPQGAIRTEELINYFTYDYATPKNDAPFAVSLDVAQAPWDARRQLVRIGLKGDELDASSRPPANLIFLVDVSGSMDEPNKLPLLQRSLRALVENLHPEDRVAMVSYAGSSGLVLPSTPASRRGEIHAAIDNLQAGGSTHGSSGITLAYELARENFLKDGANRVILCTDGDFNVGVTDQSELQKLIERERASGVFLSVLGFGTGNLKDSTMEMLANKGNGNYAYIDSFSEARKALVEQMGGTLFTIAKDVKIQVEFNPARVEAYRLIGYENRLLAKEDFNNDKKDAGEIGAGHAVTALYEIIPVGEGVPGNPSVDPLKYEQSAPSPRRRIYDASNEMLTVKFRYKAPEGGASRLLEFPLSAPEVGVFAEAPDDFRFAAAVAAFGMKLRGSAEAGDLSWDEILRIARGALGADPGSRRAEFLTLVERARTLPTRGGE